MFSFERTHDHGLVRRIMVSDRRIYDGISDDGSPAPGDFKPCEHPAIRYMLVRDGDELLGLWIFTPQNTIRWEIHTCLLPCAWGPRAREAFKAMIEWIWAYTPCQRIVTNVPRYNRLALKVAQAGGMEQFGVNQRSSLKQGVLHDRIVLGLSRPAASGGMRGERGEQP